MRKAESKARNLVMVLVALVCLACVGVVAAIASAWLAQRDAKRCLHDVLMLRVGESSFQDVMRMARPYASHRLTYPPACGPEECELTFTFQNKWPAKLRLAPLVGLMIKVVVSKGTMQSLGANLLEYDDSQLMFEARVSESSKEAMNVPEAFRFACPDPSGVFVSLTPNATMEERQRAFDFNLDCLSKLGGCNGASEYVPPMWKYCSNVASPRSE